MMLVQALRLHLDENSHGVGWFFALADKRLSAALQALHAAPGHGWILRELAAEAGMSRSVFAQRFKETVGLAPMAYLARWRMLLAADRLESGGESLAGIALDLGYDSESAFGTAFKRVIGCSPRRYGRLTPMPIESIQDLGMEPAPNTPTAPSPLATGPGAV